MYGRERRAPPNVCLSANMYVMNKDERDPALVGLLGNGLLECVGELV